MSATEKSALPGVAWKGANKAASAAAESLKRRGGAKENASLQSTVRTRSRDAVSRAQARIGTASAVLAILLSGDVRRIDWSQRIREAMVLGIAVALAAAVAVCMQFALMEKLEGASAPFQQVPLTALAAFACGAVVGYKVPVSCRMNLVTPLDPIMARALRDLLAQANATLGSDVAARDWVFAPNSELDGITPAEAVQYKTQATGVGRLLEAEAVHRREEARSERLTPKVIEGGRATNKLSSAIG